MKIFIFFKFFSYEVTISRYSKVIVYIMFEGPGWTFPMTLQENSLTFLLHRKIFFKENENFRQKIFDFFKFFLMK